MQRYCEINTGKGVMRGFMHIPTLESFPVCIIFHGFTGHKAGTKFSYVQLARRLEKAGIATLRMDFLGTGDSDLDFKDMTFKDELDCACLLVEEMKNLEQVTDIYLLGHSMGGAIASEVSKIYPDDIKKMCLWAPALNMPQLVKYIVDLAGDVDVYDHNGFELSKSFSDDLINRDLMKDLNIYNNELMIIHGQNDKTITFDLSKDYLPLYNHPIFIPIKDGSHNYDSLTQINEVMDKTYAFLTGL